MDNTRYLFIEVCLNSYIRSPFLQFLSRAESAKWFGEVVPMMANLLLRFPTLLESHYQYAYMIMVGIETGLRLLEPQQPGIVFLSQVSTSNYSIVLMLKGFYIVCYQIF